MIWPNCWVTRPTALARGFICASLADPNHLIPHTQPYEEQIIDLDTPRSPEYLQVNPRGLVPSLSYNGEIITESAIVATFLADTYPAKGLLPASTDPTGPLARARIAFFVDAWFSKVQSLQMKALTAKTDDEAAGFFEDLVKAVGKEIEPLLGNAGPFFGGSSKITLAEVSGLNLSSLFLPASLGKRREVDELILIN